MTLDIVCNFRKCRKSLTSQAWVTTCSHAFCVDHGKREFKRHIDNSLICPACNSELRDKFDVIQADLKPSETFKSIVLAGLKPDTIMDVAMRAISFWSYQIEQETLYQESLANHTKEKLQCLEEINTLNAQKLKAELDTANRKIASLQEEFKKKKKQSEELSALLEEKTRKIQKLAFQLDAQKRRDIHGQSVCKNDNPAQCMDISELVGQRAASDAFVFKPMRENDNSQQIFSPKTPIFDFRAKRKQSFQFRPLKS